MIQPVYYTYRYSPTEKQLNIDDLLDDLYGETVDPKQIREKINITYNDMSYPRNRTIVIARHKLINSDHINSRESSIRQIKAMTREIDAYLTTHIAPETDYKTFQIPKRSGGMRTINAPNTELMAFMRTLQPAFEYRLNCLPHDSAYAYVAERDCVKAVRRHQTNKSNWFLKIDLKDFFGNCSPNLIKEQLRKLYPFAYLSIDDYDKFILALTLLITKDGGLPQGTPLSPVITNLIMIPIDHAINKALYQLFKDNDFVYTRYADDMLISSRKEFKQEEIVAAIESILFQNNIPAINPTKTRYGSKAGSNWNLGVMYNKDNNLTVGYKRKKKVKTMLFQFYLMYNREEYSKDFAQALLGELAYMSNIEKDYTQKLITYLNNKYDFNFYLKLHEVVKI